MALASGSFRASVSRGPALHRRTRRRLHPSPAESAQPELRLQPLTRLGVIVSAAFFAVSAACFIPPATAGALAATALFAASSVRFER